MAMSRVVDGRMQKKLESLSPAERKKAEKLLRKMEQKNPLRRIQVECCVGWRRDPSARAGEWVWCDQHSDWTRVIKAED